MVVHSDRVYGRKQVIELVRELMAREQRGHSLRNQRFPILVVEGFRGAGKTALLDTLVDELEQRVPYARLDFEVNRRASVPQVLSALAFELSRKCPRYGALQFPRFIVGQLVTQLELDLTDHTQACKQVVAALERHREVDTLRDVLAEAAGNVLQTVGRGAGVPVEPPTRLVGLTLKWLTARAPRRVVLGSFQNWYGHRDLELTNDSVDVLVDLNRWARDAEDEDNRRRVDELLWAAFLADLRAEFDSGSRADERSLNCVALLDNADTVLGRRFLNQLTRARRQRVAGGYDDADPLSVVATSRGVLLADVPGADRTLLSPGNSRYEDLPRPTGRPRPWWLQYRLPDLVEDEVGMAVAALALDRGDNQRLTQMIFQLTHGHPAATRLVMDAIAEHPPQKWIEPEEIVRQTLPVRGSQDRLPVEDQILGRLLVGVPEEALRDLVTCAAARERQHALSLATEGDLMSGSQATYMDVIDPVLWPADEAAGSALLRRLLRRRLARRVPADPPSWTDVYSRLREICRAGGDEDGELYYALADDELGFVTRRLHHLLAELTSTAWFTLLNAVTAAPCRHPHQEILINEVHALARSAELEQPLASLGRLIAALRIAADPFSHSHRSNLHVMIAADCTDVARLGPAGPSAELLQAGRWHRGQAEWWD